MTDIWDEKPKAIYQGTWLHGEPDDKIYESVDMDAWLDALRGKYLNLADYERWWMELRELLSGYLVDCNDSDIIFSQLKEWKEKAEKWDEMEESITQIALELNLPVENIFQMRKGSMAITKALSYKNKLESIKSILKKVDRRDHEWAFEVADEIEKILNQSLATTARES